MSDFSLYQQYLQDLKSTVEGLLVAQVANVWSIYGGLNRLYFCLEKIFKHGCKISSQEGEFYHFIQGLEWLQPNTSKSNYFTLDCEYRAHVPANLKNDKSCIWLYRSLESHTLFIKLSWLLSDDSHLQSCYESWAFFNKKPFTDATLICLRAVEKNQATFLSEINPCLFLKNVDSNEFMKSHRRCSSFPDNHLKYSTKITKTSALKHISDNNNYYSSNIKGKVLGKLKPWSSLPALQIDTSMMKNVRKVHFVSRTTPNTPINCKKLPSSSFKVDYNEGLPKKNFLKKAAPISKIIKEDKIIKAIIINNSNIIEHTVPLSSSQSNEEYLNSSPSTSIEKKGFFSKRPLSMVDLSFSPRQGEKDYSRHQPKSFIEDGGMSILPMSTGQDYFPKPIKGQSLTSYLTSSQLGHSKAELDRENAHFSVSEAIISAMEKLKCQYKDLNYMNKILDSDSDDNHHLQAAHKKQRIRLRRGQRLGENRLKQWSDNLLSDARTDDTTTTVSPNSTPASSASSSEEVDDIEIDEATNLKENQGMSMSLASLYSDADIMRIRGAPDGASEIEVAASALDILSAEGVALALLSKFKEEHLPKASDLEWLVSEEDAPQALLPLPKSWPVNPDQIESPSTPLRGTRDWAPPRAQIVLTLLPPPVRKDLMEKQKYKCAGCGMVVAIQYASKFRYCYYLGKYFCTGCHKNQVSFIPARIIHKWDFKRYPVSTFSFKLLEQMYGDPLFRIFELNKNINKFSKNLDFIKKYRLGLYYLKDYIYSCRFAEIVQELLEHDLPSYFLTKSEEYSLDDLIKIKGGELKTKLTYLVDICLRHTSECKLCLARGFICEFCNAEEVIFPWQMRIATRCSVCSTCYHLQCWNNSRKKCPKCERILKRKEQTSI